MGKITHRRMDANIVNSNMSTTFYKWTRQFGDLSWIDLTTTFSDVV